MPGAKYRQLEWNAERVTRFWEWQAQYPEQYFTYQFGAAIVSHLRRYLRGCRSILDYGCGTGYLIPHLAELGGTVTGADYSAAAVESANDNNAQLRGFDGAFQVGDLVSRGGVFDATVCVEVIEHLYDRELDDLLGNIRAFSAPGACNVFTTPNEELLEANFVYCPESDVVFHRYQHVRSWGAHSLASYLESRRFEVVEVFATNLSESFTTGPRRMLRKLRRKLCAGVSSTPHLVCIARAR